MAVAQLDDETGEVRRTIWRPRHAPLDRNLKPLSLYPVPGPEAFKRGAVEYDWMEAPDVEEIADRVIERHEGRLYAAMNVRDRIEFRWKAAGGTSNRLATLGKTRKIGGAEKYYTDNLFSIWLGADNLYENPRATLRYIEMIVAHELSHITETDDDEPKTVLVGHDIEEFVWIAGAYGDVLEGPKHDFAKQLSLFGARS